MQYTVKKPINNILRVVDPTGCERIVTGRGLGSGVKPGYKIEGETVERSYRMTSPAVQTFRTTRAASLRYTSSTQSSTPP